MLGPLHQLVETARTLTREGGTFESSGEGIPMTQAELRDALMRSAMRTTGPSPGEGATVAAAAADEVLASTARAFEKVERGLSPTALTDVEASALEAIIHVTGRPAMTYLDGRVEMPPQGAGENERWRVLVATARSKINRVSASVGRVDLGHSAGLPDPRGTAWLIREDLAITNRHVADDLVENPSDDPAAWRLDGSLMPTLNFSAVVQPSQTTFTPITGITYVSDDLDLALLQIDPVAVASLQPLPLDWKREALGRAVPGPDGEATFDGAHVYVVGHPLLHFSTPASRAVFGRADGGKRWCPGRLTDPHSGDTDIEHDCSTLGGHSGSCVVSVHTHRILGLHFGGLSYDPTTARGRANVAHAFARLTDHPISALLQVN